MRADPRAADLLLPKGPLATIWNSYKVLGCRFLTKYICTEPGTVNLRRENSIQKVKIKAKKKFDNNYSLQLKNMMTNLLNNKTVPVSMNPLMPPFCTWWCSLSPPHGSLVGPTSVPHSLHLLQTHGDWWAWMALSLQQKTLLLVNCVSVGLKDIKLSMSAIKILNFC